MFQFTAPRGYLRNAQVSSCRGLHVNFMLLSDCIDAVLQGCVCLNLFSTMHALGAPNQEFLAQEITSSDHPFLRGNVPSIQSYRRAIKGTPAFQPVPT